MAFCYRVAINATPSKGIVTNAWRHASLEFIHFNLLSSEDLETFPAQPCPILTWVVRFNFAFLLFSPLLDQYRILSFIYYC